MNMRNFPRQEREFFTTLSDFGLQPNRVKAIQGFAMTDPIVRNVVTMWQHNEITIVEALGLLVEQLARERSRVLDQLVEGTIAEMKPIDVHCPHCHKPILNVFCRSDKL